MTAPLPSLLVVDERLARDSAARGAFIEETGLSPSKPDGGKAVNAPIGFVEFCSGQREDGKGGWVNDYPTIKTAVADDTDALSLVLLNARLRTHADDDADDFGERVFRQLSEDFPSVPVIQFTSKFEKNLGHDVGGRYLYKDDVGRRSVIETLLRHGRLSPRQMRGLLGLAQSTIAEAPSTLQVFSDAYIHADEDSPVLLLGESGVGKEVVANYIHRNSHRQAGPFIPVNMTAIAHDLAESTLFGHIKGSFTGAAADHKGLFEQADTGTLFLDEIGDMSFGLQSKLLRAIQEGEVTRIGAQKPTKVSVRLICATSANLAAAMAEGRFRRDLYYRLAGVTLLLPPLRKRPSDIPPLAVEFLRREQENQGKTGIEFSDDALTKLESQPFQGNVRELELLVRRLVGRTGSGRILSGTEITAELGRAGLPEAPLIATINAANIPAASSITTLWELLDAIDGFKPRMDEVEGAKPLLEAAIDRLLHRLAEVAMARYRRVDGSPNITGAMSALEGAPVLGTKAQQLLKKLLPTYVVETASATADPG